VWIGTTSNGACIFDGMERTEYTVDEGLYDNYSEKIETAPDGTIRFVTGRAISCLKLE
jgi:hypothetical protein